MPNKIKKYDFNKDDPETFSYVAHITKAI